MTPTPVSLTTDGPVATITLHRPACRNAVDGPTAAALRAAFDQFEADASLAVAVFTGGGGQFCAGADLKAVADGSRRNQATPDGSGPGPMGPTRQHFSKPVIAAVEGHAVAGGLELALMCDLRVAARGAIFGVYCRRWGVPLIDGGTVRLPRIVGQARALDMILTGRAVGADEALAMGLVDRVVEPEELYEEALAWARTFAEGAVAAQALAKVAVDRGLEGSLAHGLDLEQDLFVEVFRTDDARIGVDSFREHGPGHARFTGR